MLFIQLILWDIQMQPYSSLMYIVPTHFDYIQPSSVDLRYALNLLQF